MGVNKMNLKIREFKISIENYIKNTDLPSEVKRMVLKEIYESVSAEADEAVREEIAERDSAERGGADE